MILKPTLNKIGSLPDFSPDDWVDEPLLHRASVSFALLNEGKIIKSFLAALPISSDNYQEWMIDLRFHHLKENELPSMDCWHLDFFTPGAKRC